MPGCCFKALIGEEIWPWRRCTRFLGLEKSIFDPEGVSKLVVLDLMGVELEREDCKANDANGLDVVALGMGLGAGRASIVSEMSRLEE